MKQCPTCELIYTDERLNYCKWDGALLTDVFKPEGTHALTPPYVPPVPLQHLNLATGIKGIWLYEFSKVVKDAVPQVVANLQRHKINTVFLSVTRHWLNKYPLKIKYFIEATHQKGIKVHAMTLQDSRFVETQNHEDARQRIEQILEFCRKHQVSAFDGIHLDAEPHTHKLWKETSGMDDTSRTKWKVRENLMKQYLALIKKISRQINDSDLSSTLQFSSTVGWWYDGRAKNGNLPSGAASILGEYLDFLVPMVYDGRGASGKDVIGCVKNTVKAAPTVIGVAVKEFPSYSKLIEGIKEVENYFQRSETFMGICIYDYKSLVDEYNSLKMRGKKRNSEVR